MLHIQRGVRGWISFFVWLLAVVPEARAVFLVEYKGAREPVQIHSILSVNPDGVVLRPLGGGFGNGVRHRWDQFTVRTLGVLMSELLKDPLFNQKSRDAKFKIINALETARTKQSPVVIAPPNQPVQPVAPSAPLPVIVTNAPAPRAVNPKTRIPRSVPAPAPTNSLPALPKSTNPMPAAPTATNVASPPAPVFQLVEPPDVSAFPERRPPASGLSPEAVFNSSGIFLALLVMGLSGYAGYEIARFKNRPVKLVCILSAVLPVLGPAVFLAMPPQQATSVTRFASPGVPSAAELPGTTPPTPLPTVRDLKYEDDPDSPYANLTDGAVEETQFADDSAAAPVPVAKSLERYHGSEYEFTPAFFSEYFAQFVGAAATTGEALILRTNANEYSVHYISVVDATGLQFIFASQGQWMEEFLVYADITEVEVLGHA